MTTIVSDTRRCPRPEDFGLTEEFAVAAQGASERRLGRWMLAVYAALGREIAAARRDLGVERAVLVAPAGAADDLVRYLGEHGGAVLDALGPARLRAIAAPERGAGARL